MVGPSPIGGSELESQLAKANISISYAFSPIQFILCDLSGLIGNFCQEPVSYTHLTLPTSDLV